MDQSVNKMSLDPEFVAMLCCPACEDRPPVRIDGEDLVCTKCGRRYPVENGVPRMIVDEEPPAS